jgi:hypothetical protein
VAGGGSGDTGARAATIAPDPTDPAAPTHPVPPETGREPAGPPPTAAPWIGRAIVVVAVALAVVVLLAGDLGMPIERLVNQWQLLDIHALTDDPLGSVWYLHTQPPGYNLLVGLVAWSPFPLAGTLYALNALALLGTGLLLHDILRRWGTAPVAAGAVAAVAVLGPSLLSALYWGHYEILVAFLLVAAVAGAQRFFDDPRPRWLFSVVVAVTACGLLRSLFHPVWVLAAIVLLIVLRPVPRRYAVAALGIPAVLFGGWMLKNALLFDSATTSSWLGFNLQRGVVASMTERDVREGVASGSVSSLALEYPWGTIDQYGQWAGTCRPHGHPVTRLPEKDPVNGLRIANFNHECYLPVYRQAQADALQLALDHPGRYLASRLDGLVMAYQTADTGIPPDETWIDRLYRPALLIVEVRIPQDDWNLPLLGSDDITADVSLTLLALSLFVAARGAVAVRRLARRGWSGRTRWPAQEVLWALVAATVALVVLGGCLIEFGENGRFRSSLDPLLIGLPLGWVVQAVSRRGGGAPPPDERAGDGAAAPVGDGSAAGPEPQPIGWSTTPPLPRSTS